MNNTLSTQILIFRGIHLLICLHDTCAIIFLIMIYWPKALKKIKIQPRWLQNSDQGQVLEPIGLPIYAHWYFRLIQDFISSPFVQTSYGNNTILLKRLQFGLSQILTNLNSLVFQSITHKKAPQFTYQIRQHHFFIQSFFRHQSLQAKGSELQRDERAKLKFIS